MNQIGIPPPHSQGQHYPRRQGNGLVTASADPQGQSQYQTGKSLWWYQQLQWRDDKPVANEKISSFNARDLDKRL